MQYTNTKSKLQGKGRVLITKAETAGACQKKDGPTKRKNQET
jgi:hypothetical protein